jgi:hypothetical protein
MFHVLVNRDKPRSYDNGTGGQQVDANDAVSVDTDYGQLWTQLIPKINDNQIDGKDKLMFEMTSIANDGQLNLAYDMKN